MTTQEHLAEFALRNASASLSIERAQRSPRSTFSPAGDIIEAINEIIRSNMALASAIGDLRGVPVPRPETGDDLHAEEPVWAPAMLMGVAAIRAMTAKIDLLDSVRRHFAQERTQLDGALFEMIATLAAHGVDVPAVEGGI